MRKLVLILLLISCNAAAQVTANLTGKSLDEFFFVASKAFDKTLIVDPSVNGKVKVYQVQNAANFRDVFFSVMRAHNLVYVESKTVLRVSPRNQMKAGDKVITKTFKLNHVRGVDLLSPLSKSLEVQSSTWKMNGITHVDSILADTVLMVTAPNSMLSNVESLLSHIDVPQQQVRVKAVIIEHTIKDIKERTVDLKVGSGDLKVGFNGSPLSVTNTLSNIISTNPDVGLLVKYMEQTGNTNILSRPEVTILNGFSGLITVGQELPFITGQYTTDTDTSDRPFQTIERKDVGLMLNVKPFIGANGDITLTINQELSRVDKSIEATDIATSKRTISTTLRTKYGQTVVLAGMTSKESQTLKSKVPFLGDVPYLGVLFSSESDVESKRTLTVLLTVEKV